MSRKFILLVLLLILPVTVLTQTKTKKPVKKPVKKTTTTSTASKPVPSATGTTTTETTAPKKNERPGETTPSSTPEPKKANRAEDAKKPAPKPAYPYFYEFNQSAFYISKVIIEHDDNGKGTVTFTKRDFDGESFTDPLQLSAVTMQKLKAWWGNLNFLDSTENYQATRDFSHLGVIKLRLKRDGRERLVEFNWTENKDAKSLMDEYRNLGQLYVWIFDITLSRENQPLEAPKLMENMDGMLRRNEISDPQNILPLLKDLSEDERIPLLARNHALKIVKQIEKEKK